MKQKLGTLLTPVLIAGVVLAACAQHTPRQATSSASATTSVPASPATKRGGSGKGNGGAAASNGPASANSNELPPAPANPSINAGEVRRGGGSGEGNGGAAASNSPASANSTELPPAPANPSTNPEKPGGEGGGGEGGKGAEAPRGPTLTNPGGLPPAPASNDPALSQLGEERMVRALGPKGQFSILFVDKWKQGPGKVPNSLRSTQEKWYAEAEVIPAGGETPGQAAQALDASKANGATGYRRLGLQKGDVHGLPAASLIYEYEAGTNPVTGKHLRFIASQVFIGGGPTGKLGHVTFVAPYAFYGDLTEVFDKILVGFAWKK